jgi:FO synthase
VKNTVPDIHVHAFSPLEVFQGASTLGVSVQEFLVKLKNAGLGSLPGTAAEVLDDEVRSMLCPDKITTNEWLEIMETAHVVGLKTTSTIMFGHLDSPHHWARHLLLLRSLARKLSTSSVVTRLLVGAPRASPKACVESLPGAAEEAAPGCFASHFQCSL